MGQAPATAAWRDPLEGRSRSSAVTVGNPPVVQHSGGSGYQQHPPPQQLDSLFITELHLRGEAPSARMLASEGYGGEHT